MFKDFIQPAYFLYFFGVFIFAIALSTSILTGIPLALFTRDPAQIVYIHPAYGVLSQIGILTWTAAATICFFCAHQLHRTNNISKPYTAFYFMGGLLTSILLIDDLFIVHDRLAPQYLKIPEKVMFAVYTVIVFVWLLYFRAIIFIRTWGLLIAALAFFTFSVIVDLLVKEQGGNLHLLFEDGAKWLGIVGWLAYWWTMACNTLKDILTAGSLCESNLSNNSG